ncbi:MAG: hypothetical protein ACKO7A_07685, partial [Microcystis sp.]
MKNILCDSKEYGCKEYGCIDVNSFPGSSGSPVCIVNESHYCDKESRSFKFGSSRLILLGILGEHH